ncbi:AraC family transcriptional regulator [Sphingobium sp.]|uniref:AraC family transcriptional regulator n=1 Tax=Sphingobium sp. TaxID=1912891 RepID=UPI00262CC219|nr:AraC family transcriptional regulator [Sphingobium sp.]
MSDIDTFLAPRLAKAAGGIDQTGIEGVRVFWTTASTPPEPLIYDAGITILLTGCKNGVIADRSFVYDQDNYLVVTLPTPFLCSHDASPDAPLCGLFVSASREDLSSLMRDMAEMQPVPPRSGAAALAPASVTKDMRTTIARMIGAIDDPLAARVIGPALRRELLFHALRGPCGPSLAGYAQQTGDDGRLDALIEAIRLDIAQPIRVDAMAEAAAMSLSAFHRAFWHRTGQSPLQYVKRLRLHAARDMIVYDRARVGDAARRVGYESVSQFSREYHRHFDIAPTTARLLTEMI